VQGQADATWVFTGWEGIQARRAGIGLHAFRLQECGIPYAYPLLLVTSEHVLRCGACAKGLNEQAPLSRAVSSRLRRRPRCQQPFLVVGVSAAGVQVLSFVFAQRLRGSAAASAGPRC